GREDKNRQRGGGDDLRKRRPAFCAEACLLAGLVEPLLELLVSNVELASDVREEMPSEWQLGVLKGIEAAERDLRARAEVAVQEVGETRFTRAPGAIECKGGRHR